MLKFMECTRVRALSRVAGLLLGALMVLTPLARAELLGVSPFLPLISFVDQSGDGVSVHFELLGDGSGNGVLTIADAEATVLSRLGIGNTLITDGLVNVRVVVDSDGNLVGGLAQPDLVITGSVAGVSGELLTGDVYAFGFEDNGAGVSDRYDFAFHATGGALFDEMGVAGADFTGLDVGMVVTAEQPSVNGKHDFDVNFTSEAKGSVGQRQACVDVRKQVRVDPAGAWLDADTLADAAMAPFPGEAEYRFVVGNCGLNALTMVSLTMVLLALVGQVTAAERIDSTRDIRPILSDRCFACHGPDRWGAGDIRLSLVRSCGR